MKVRGDMYEKEAAAVNSASFDVMSPDGVQVI